MFKLFSLLAVPAVVLAATAGVARDPARSFKHEGVTYVYETSVDADGRTILTGHALPNGSRFRLVVKDGQVSGHVGQQPVRFSVAESRGAADGAVQTPAPIRLAAVD